MDLVDAHFEGRAIGKGAVRQPAAKCAIGPVCKD